MPYVETMQSLSSIELRFEGSPTGVHTRRSSTPILLPATTFTRHETTTHSPSTVRASTADNSTRAKATVTKVIKTESTTPDKSTFTTLSKIASTTERKPVDTALRTTTDHFNETNGEFLINIRVTNCDGMRTLVSTRHKKFQRILKCDHLRPGTIIYRSCNVPEMGKFRTCPCRCQPYTNYGMLHVGPLTYYQGTKKEYILGTTNFNLIEQPTLI